MKQFAELIPREVGLILAECTVANQPKPKAGIRRRILVAFCSSALPQIAQHFATSENANDSDFDATKLPHSFQTLLEFQPQDLEDQKVNFLFDNSSN